MPGDDISEAGHGWAARRGSILIVVIMLLLLLAILGAAYISTARNDRLGSIQFTNNNQIDAMTDGVAQIVKGTIAGDINDYQGNMRGAEVYRGTYNALTVYSLGDVVDDGLSPRTLYSYVNPTAGSGQPLLSSTTATNTGYWQAPSRYYPVTSSFTQPWLASRVPDQLPITSSSNPVWTNITQALSATGEATSLINVQPFEDPTTGVQFAGYGTPNELIYNAAPGFTGTAVTGYPGGLPTLAIPTGYTAPGATPSGTAKMVAADADGDGVADSLWARIPGAYYDGLTWYYGVRIVDNNSAINANTAWESGYDFTTTSFATHVPACWGCFPGDVGFNELLSNDGTGSADSLQGIISYRNGNPTPKVTGGTPPEYTDGGSGANYSPPAGSAVYDDSGVYGSTTSVPTAARSDVQYITQKDAQFNQFARRMDNPGYNVPNSNAPNYGRFQALPLADTAALAHDFILVNPNITAPSSLIETFLPTTLYYNKATTPYSTIAAWAPNFNYNSSGFNCRPLIVTRNGVSNYICPIYDPNYGLSPMGNWETELTNNDSLAPPMLPYGPTTFTDHQNHFKGNWYPEYGQYSLLNSATLGYQQGDIVVRRVNVQPPTGSAGTLADTDDWVDQVTPGTASGYGGTTAASASFRMGPNYTFFSKGGPVTTFPSGKKFAMNAGHDPAAMSGGILTNNLFWDLQPYTRHPTKANVNTATFRELYRAFFSVFVGSASSPFLSPFGPVPSLNPYDNSNNTTTNPQLCLRSPLRDPTGAVGTAAVTRLDPPAVMQLRAAIAAVNTLGLRNQSQNVISRTVYLRGNWRGVDPCPAGATAYATAQNNWAQTSNVGSEQFNAEARVFSSACNPIICMVHINTNVADNSSAGNPYDANNPGGQVSGSTVSNPNGYIGIYLYNPYSVAILMTNWQLATINRSAAAYGTTNAPSLSFGTILVDHLGHQIPLPQIYLAPHTACILENYSSNSTTNQVFYGDTYTPVLNGSGGVTWTFNNGTATAAPSVDANFRPATMDSSNTNFMGGGENSSSAPQDGDTSQANYNFWSHSNLTGSSTVLSADRDRDVFVHGLHGAIGQEVVLLRPRRYDGTYTSSTDPQNTYNEGTPTAPNYYDMVPVDSFDSTGLPTAATGAAASYVWWFNRANNGGNGQQYGSTTPGPFPYAYEVMPGRAGGGALSETPATLGLDCTSRGEFGGPYNGTRGTSGTTPRQWDHNGDTTAGGAGNPNFPAGAWPPTTSTAYGPFPGTYAAKINSTATADPIPPNSCVVWDSQPNNTSCVSSFIDGFPPVELNGDCYNSLGGMPGPNPVIMNNNLFTTSYNSGTELYTTTSLAQISIPGAGGVNSLQEYPFGGFARAGDMLDIPFAGAYRIRDMNNQVGTANFVEMNSLPMDLFFTSVEDMSPTDEGCENLGRFCPMSARSTCGSGSVPTAANDYYWWTTRIFDYLTVNSPSEMYTPEFDPALRDVTYTGYVTGSTASSTLALPTISGGSTIGAGSQVQSAYAYSPTTYQSSPAYFPGNAPASNGSSPPLFPSQVYSVDGTATDQTDQDTAPVEGLININTAPVPVLQMLPGMTLTLAQAIVAYRDAHGPFMSLFDLNRVPGFQTASGSFQNNPSSTCPNNFVTNGLPWNQSIMPGGFDSGLSAAASAAIPNGSGFPGANGTQQGNLPTLLPEDFRNDFATMTRVSNLTTTRSDTFTVFIVVAGWSNAGTSSALPRVVRRYAFIVDRSAINGDPDARTPKTYTVPTD